MLLMLAGMPARSLISLVTNEASRRFVASVLSSIVPARKSATSTAKTIDMYFIAFIVLWFSVISLQM